MLGHSDAASIVSLLITRFKSVRYVARLGLIKELQLVYGVLAPRVVSSMATTMEVYMLPKDCT